MTYLDNLTVAMAMLWEYPRSVFLGQSIVAGGTAMTRTFLGVSRDRMIEFPVCENTQLGTAIGLALGGDLPVCVFPRINFLLCAIDALVLHLDALPLYSEYRPRVIIRTAVANPAPLVPGPQHLGDYTNALRAMLRTVTIERIDRAADVLPAYRAALARPLSTILVERAELYGTE